MPFSRLPGGAAFEFVCELDGSICETTITAQYGTVPPSLNLEGMTGLLGLWWQYQVLPNLSVFLTYHGCQSRNLDTDGSIAFFTPAELPNTGGVGGNVHPANVAFRVTLNVEAPPQDHRGCAFVPGIPHGVVTGNTLHQDFVDVILEAYNLNLHLPEATGWRWVVQNKWRDGVFLSPSHGAPVTKAVHRGLIVAARRSRLHNEPLP